MTHPHPGGTAPELSAAIARIDAGGRADFADTYAGVEIDETHGRAIVYRVPSAAFDDFARLSSGHANVELRDAAHPLAVLKELQERLTADLPHWSQQGIRIHTIGARHDGTGVEVGTEDVAAARRELPARYGTDAPVIVVEQGPVVPLPMPGAATW